LLGDPVLPVADPAEADSPGTRICSLANAPATTVIDGLVFAVFVPSVMSVAVTVHEPAVFNVTVNAFVPATIAALAGSAAFASLDVMPTVSVLLTTFQFASTALTVTLNDVPAVWLLGEPVLPVADPAEADSPGTRICSFANAPATTVIDGLVFAVFVPSVISVAVIVLDPTVFSVTVKFFVPATIAAFAGNVAFASLDVMPTVSVLLTGFQLASTAFTVTLNAEPAV
jgi:hypothetical protein